MSDNPGDPAIEEPANLKFLRRLVTTLTATMIIGLVVLIGLIVIRLQTPLHPIAFPEAITLPDGVTAQTYTQGPGWYAIVTTDNEILIFDADSGEIRQRVGIE